MGVNKKEHCEKCCETCDNLIAIGSGDHICYECHGTNGEPCIVPISDYQPTGEYLMCGGNKYVY